MTTEIKYYADDGTEFDNEEDCRFYEDEFSEAMRSVVFLDAGYNILTRLEDIESKTEYIFIKDATEAKNLFARLYNMISLWMPECPYNDGACLALDYDGDWFNLTATAVDYANKIESIVFKVWNLV